MGRCDTSDWSDLVPSGDSVSASHTWSDTGTYSIRAQAEMEKTQLLLGQPGTRSGGFGNRWTKTLGGAVTMWVLLSM